MSRVGRKPIIMPQGVKVTLQDHTITVEGPLGKLSQDVPAFLKVDIGKDSIVLQNPSVEKKDDAVQGLMRSLIANMVLGTTKGFEKVLYIEGTGFRAAVEDRKLNLQLGFTHPVILDIPKGIEVNVEKQVRIHIKGADKQLLGEWTAKIRDFKPPEPYKGKGIRYIDEYIKKKIGKAAIKQTT